MVRILFTILAITAIVLPAIAAAQQDLEDSRNSPVDCSEN